VTIYFHVDVLPLNIFLKKIKILCLPYTHWYYARPRDATHLIQTGYFSELYVFKKHYSRWGFFVMRLLTVVEVTLRMAKWVISLFIKPSERKTNQERLRVGWQTIKMALSMW